MKHIILIVFLLNIFKVGHSQNNYRITYRHNLQYDTLKMLRDTMGMEATLTGNSFESNYIFPKRPKNPSVDSKTPVAAVDDLIKNKKSGTFTVGAGGKGPDSIGNMLYQNKKTKTTLVREKMINEYIITEEQTPKIDWKITDEVKMIKEYSCKKATANFRGRDYVAWFTTDLPIVAGPWKFSGLPGLVLDIEDSKFQVKIYAEKIEYPVNDKVPVFVNNGTKIQIDKYFAYRNEEFSKRMLGTQQLLMKQDNMAEIIAAGGQIPKATTTVTMYSIELRKD